jgi:aryl-alcohol dehydrogenase-like predicted oxidoreductase
MLHRVIEGKVVPASEELGISQIVWSPMAQGVLSGKYLPGQPVPDGSRATDPHSGADFIKGLLRDEILEAVQRLKPIAAEAGLTMPQLAIAWVLQNPNVAAALVGASRPEQLADTVKASGVTLDADTMAAIDTALGDVPNRDAEHTYSVSPKARLV